MLKKSVVYLSVLLISCFIAGHASAGIKIPGRTGSLVNDYAGALSPETRTYLEKLLREKRGNNFTGTEIIVSIFETMGDMRFHDFIDAYARKWRRPYLLENENQIHLILIMKKGKLSLAAGVPLRKIMTAEVIDDILNKVVSPELKNGNYDEGIKKGAEAILDVLNRSDLPKNYSFIYARAAFGLILLTLALIAAVIIRHKVKI